MPTTVVTRGEFVEVVELRGDIRTVRSVVLGAPTQSGELQIVRLVKNGTPVKAGDVVIEFDQTALLRQQTDRRAELKQAQAETERAQAQAHIQEEASATNLLRARFDVNRARLDVVDRDFVARIEYERAKGLVAVMSAATSPRFAALRPSMKRSPTTPWAMRSPETSV